MWMSNLGYCANEIMFCFAIYSCRERLSHFVLSYVMGRGRLGFIFNDQNSCTAARECLDSLGLPLTAIGGELERTFFYVGISCNTGGSI